MERDRIASVYRYSTSLSVCQSSKQWVFFLVLAWPVGRFFPPSVIKTQLWPRPSCRCPGWAGQSLRPSSWPCWLWPFPQLPFALTLTSFSKGPFAWDVPSTWNPLSCIHHPQLGMNSFVSFKCQLKCCRLQEALPALADSIRVSDPSYKLGSFSQST